MALMWTYVVVDLLRAVVLLVLGLRTAARELDQPGPASLSLLRPRLRELVGFSIHNWLTSVLALVTREVDVLILAAFRGDREVGFYRMAKNFTRLLVHVYDPVYQAIYPELVRLREQVEDMREVWRFIRRTMGWVLALFVPLTIMIALGAPIIVRMSVGSEFLPAAPAVRIMVFGVLVNAALVWSRPLALTAGRPDVSTKAFAASAVILAVTSALLVPRFGYMGSAVTYLITLSSVAILSAAGATHAAMQVPPSGSEQ
jgi:PST family polysaccharide transporter